MFRHYVWVERVLSRNAWFSISLGSLQQLYFSGNHLEKVQICLIFGVFMKLYHEAYSKTVSDFVLAVGLLVTLVQVAGAHS